MNLEQNVIPKEFPEWKHIFTTWGGFQKQCAFTVAEMVALGLGLEKHSIRETMEKGQLIASPPGVNLEKIKKGDMMTSFHRDFDVLTIHGKTRFPGLLVWTKDGERFKPAVPDEHFLIHGGRQLEWLTGGYLMPAYHEVYYS